MFENKFDSDRFLVVVLVLVDRRIVSVFVSIRLHVVTDADIRPAKSFGDLAMLRWERNGPTAKVFADIAHFPNFTLLVVARRPQRNPGCLREGSTRFFCL